jgi:hypothetical protein
VPGDRAVSPTARRSRGQAHALVQTPRRHAHHPQQPLEGRDIRKRRYAPPQHCTYGKVAIKPSILIHGLVFAAKGGSAVAAALSTSATTEDVVVALVR